jgi:hypothetical protein
MTVKSNNPETMVLHAGPHRHVELVFTLPPLGGPSLPYEIT